MPFVDDSLDAERDLGRAEGRRKERDRLRPLLKECVEVILCSASGAPRRREIVLDRLRTELGEKEKP